MTKIILDGKYKTYETTCRHCNSDIEYTTDDVFQKKEVRESMAVMPEYHLFSAPKYYVNLYKYDASYIVCPRCHEHIRVRGVTQNTFVKRVGTKQIDVE